MNLLLLAWEFFKTGLFATGGGLATLPFLQRMSIAHPEWFTLDMLADMVAVSESTPGPLGINMAVYVGYTVEGIPGALVATLALVLPSLVIIMLIAAFLEHYMDKPWVNNMFSALRPAVTGLIAAAGYAVVRMAILTPVGISWPAVILFLSVLVLRLIKPIEKLHPILFIGAGALIGILLGM